jgi:hypothetical protein
MARYRVPVPTAMRRVDVRGPPLFDLEFTWRGSPAR